MGVKGLWQLLEPVGRPVTLESLEGRVLSVDSSILLNQAVKGMRDKSGNPLPNAHLIVLFNRLCKLLFYRVKPIFIFDGGVPVLKKKTLAARRERKFKARHGANKAAEKIVKNYLKGKAIETVTGRKSANAIFRNIIQTDTDIFDLPPINLTQEAMQESSSSEDDDGQPISGQHDIEKKFQNPSSINVESEDFRSLPEEIQHELIKDIMEERKWATIQSMPQDAFNFSDYQLQSVLQRGKLHHRLDELRKEMNNRNNGEVSGLSSQDALGANSSVLSQRIVSEDSSHYVLIKTSKNSNSSQGTDADPPMVSNLTEGGFLREDPQVQPQQTKPTSYPLKPSFHMDLTYASSSDSEPDSSLLDVPEVVLCFHDLDKQPKKTGQWTFDPEVERKRDSSGNVEGDIKVKDVLQQQSIDALGNNMEDVVQVEENKLDRKGEGHLVSKRRGQEEQVVVSDGENKTTMEETLNELSLNEDQTEDSVSIEGQIQKRKSQIEAILSKRQSESRLSTREDVCEKTVKDAEFPINRSPSTVRENDYRVLDNHASTSVLPADDGSIEVESSSDQEEDHVSSRDHGAKSEINRMEDVEVRPDIQHDDRVKSLSREELEQDSSDIADQDKEVLHVDDRDDELQENARKESEEGMEIVKVNHEETILVPDVNNTEAVVTSSQMSAPTEFVGMSKEDLEVIQENLEMEQQSLQAEKARQERMAATLSNEMLTESQELLQLFGVPYLVSPMEAEAQCAFLDLTKQTSGTITDDSDVFLFGGTRVYKHIFNQSKHAELYTLDAISGNLALDRSKMIKLAFITGSDYTEGIQGLGAVGAMEVLQEFNSDGFEALLKFKKWHDETKKNKYIPQETKVKQKLRTVTLPTGFPSQEVFNSYINPVIDNSREAFEWGKPDLHGLRLFAREKLGWSEAKTDEILLPVVQQMNKQETQMRMDNFFQINFHETRKKSSKRVRRVINRFLNPPSSSESSSDDEGIKTKLSDDKITSNAQSSSVKGKGKETGSRIKIVGPRVTRGRGRGQSRGCRAARNAVNTEHLEDVRGVSGRSVTTNDHVESDTVIYMRDSEAGLETGHGLLDRKYIEEGRKVQKRRKNKNDQEIPLQQKGKSYVIMNKDNFSVSQNNAIDDVEKTQGYHKTERNNPNNLLSNFQNNDNDESMLGPVNRNNVNNETHKIPKKSFTTRKKEAVSSGFRKMNDDSSTSSDTDPEEGGRISLKTNKNGGRGVGRKRTRGRGRGRGGTVKRSKIEKRKSEKS